jgi:acetyl esterase
MALSQEEKQQLSMQVRSKSLVDPVLSMEYRQFLDRVTVEDTQIDTREGKTHIFIIRAKNRTKYCPVYINIHGGGFVRPHGERNIIFCAKFADRMRGIVVDLDYRLAPEYPYPAAFHEAYDTVQWVFDQAQMLDIDPLKVIVGGDSAGGNLTAAVAIRAQETGDFRICLQMLYYPATDMLTPPEDKPEADISMINPQRSRAFNRLYLDDDQEAAQSPYVSMKFAPEQMLHGLPEMLLITAGKDNMRFEAEEYAMRLVATGVPVTIRRFLNSRHSFLVNCIDEWEEGQELIAKALLQVANQP